MTINKYFSTVVNFDINIPPNTPKCCKLKINFFSDFLSDQGGQPRRRLNIYHLNDSSSRKLLSPFSLYYFHSTIERTIVSSKTGIQCTVSGIYILFIHNLKAWSGLLNNWNSKPRKGQEVNLDIETNQSHPRN